ncbi:MAG: amino acid racemase [Rhodospirillales bacterium]
MQKIGVIGGLSWVSTADYYRRLNQMTQGRLGGVASARLVIESVNRQDYVDAVIDRQDEAAACEIIRDAAVSLQKAGADFLVISCNDVHRFVPELEPSLSIPFLHIAEATADAIIADGFNKVALMGVRKTMEGDFYPRILKARGIETLIPDDDERSYIHDSIYNELVKDIFTDETRAGYVGLIERFRQRGARGTILGCTEIPLLIRDGDTEVPTYSTTELHCRAAVARAMG